MTTVAQEFDLLRNGDGTLDGDYPDDAKPATGGTLTWTGANGGLQAAGISDLRTGVPFTHNIRQYLSGSAAAGATFSFDSPTGDDPVASGFTFSGDNLLFTSAVAHSGTFKLKATNGATVAITNVSIAWVCTTSVAPVRVFYYEASFESQQLLPKSSSPLLDSGFLACIPEPYGPNGLDHVAKGSGGFGPTSQTEVRVVQSDTAPTVDGHLGEAVISRTGASGWFLRSQITRNKDYRWFVTGSHPYGRPRWYMSLFSDIPNPNPATYVMNSTGVGIAVDRVWFLGWSMYFPTWYPAERGGNNKDQRGNGLVDMLVDNDSASNGWWKVSDRVDTPAATAPHNLIFDHYLNAGAINTTGASNTEVVLAPISAVRGHWVDFTLRARENPFTVSRNPATGVGGSVIPNSINHLFGANTGVLQLKWKLDTDVTWNFPVDITGPTGLVPIAAYSRYASLRQYKHSWLRLNGSPAGPAGLPARAAMPVDPACTPPTSTQTGDSYIAFDEVRFGYEDLGTNFASVAPGP